GGAGGFGGPVRFFDNWTGGFNLAWELDFWGKFRRAIESANASLGAAFADYDDVVVILLSDVATTYVQLRTFQRRLELARINVAETEPMVAKMRRRFDEGVKTSLPDYYQLKSNLENTRALIAPLEVGIRVANDKLCVLLGMSPRDLLPLLGDGKVPTPDGKGM